MILQISTHPIQIPTKTRPSIPKADWEKYQSDLQLHPIATFENANTEDIEHAVETWQTQIQNTSKDTIPNTQYKTIPHIKTTHKLRTLQITYTHIIHDIMTNGPSIQKQHNLIHIRTQLQTEYRRLFIESWDRQIQKLNETNDSKQFWTAIKKLQGNSNKTNLKYIHDHQNNIIQEPRQIESIFRNHWQKIFTI